MYVVVVVGDTVMELPVCPVFHVMLPADAEAVSVVDVPAHIAAEVGVMVTVGPAEMLTSCEMVLDPEILVTVKSI